MRSHRPVNPAPPPAPPNRAACQVPTLHGKADLTLYRQASAKVMALLAAMATAERASIDEVGAAVGEDTRATSDLGDRAVPLHWAGRGANRPGLLQSN